MSKTIVLELTEAEANYLGEALDADLDFAEDSDSDDAWVDRALEINPAIQKKLENAQQGQEELHHAFDAMMGHPMEALDKVTAREGENGGQ